MSGIMPMMPAISEDGDFIIEIQSRCGTYWKPVIAPLADNIDYHYGKPYLLSDYVHASILADLHRKTTNLPTRVNALKVCYIHFKSYRLDPDIWYLYNPVGAFEHLQSAIKGCEDLLRTEYITETCISFTKDTEFPGCYYSKGQTASTQIQLGEGANDDERIQTDGDHPT